MLTVYFHCYSPRLGKTFTNVEVHRSLDDARLRACALNWQIARTEPALPVTVTNSDGIARTVYVPAR
jgi:hypothetical protein